MKLVEEYSHNAQNLDSVLGFLDGMVAAIKLVNELLREERESKKELDNYWDDIVKNYKP